MHVTIPNHALHSLQVRLQVLEILGSLASLLDHNMSCSEEDSSLEESDPYDDYDEDEEEEEESEGEDEEEDLYVVAKEKQISVDPISLKYQLPGPPQLITPKFKFVSCSLPCSATSSPQSSSTFPKNFKKWNNPTQKPHPALHSEHYATSSRYAQQRGLGLFRSKSCGDGRSSQPSDEFDILSRRRGIDIKQPQSGGVRVRGVEAPRRCGDTDEVKCGALCLFLPAFSKKKQVQEQLDTIREVKEENDDDGEEEEEEEEEEEGRSMISRVASLEKFECASWASVGINNDDDFGGGISAYFDLPMELIRGSCDDAHSPVRAAFVFDGERKGGLKKSTPRSTDMRKSHESMNRHVRFSTSAPLSFPSSPTSECVTPRLAKAREEFNALLEAQSACINF